MQTKTLLECRKKYLKSSRHAKCVAFITRTAKISTLCCRLNGQTVKEVVICKDINEVKKPIHLKSKEGEYNVNDVKLEPLQAGFTRHGLVYG